MVLNFTEISVVCAFSELSLECDEKSAWWHVTGAQGEVQLVPSRKHSVVTASFFFVSVLLQAFRFLCNESLFVLTVSSGKSLTRPRQQLFIFCDISNNVAFIFTVLKALCSCIVLVVTHFCQQPE